MDQIRHDWTRDELAALFDLPLLDLVYRAGSVHRNHFDSREVQISTLLSIKTGACPEDCAYCPQSAHFKTGLDVERLLPLDVVRERAAQAKAAGATRFCMGAAWREVKEGPAFDKVVKMVEGVKELGLEACCTLGMLTPAQAKRLKDAGLDAYNHNLDTSRDAYGSIISTRTYDDRLRTLAAVREAGITVCSGGIIGMGESIDDRCMMLVELARMDPQPESVPINALVRVAGTPLESLPPVEAVEFVRMIATARLMMPRSMVRLSAGREQMSKETQALCFLAGANSMFVGDRLLTTSNPGRLSDDALMAELGLKPMGGAASA